MQATDKNESNKNKKFGCLFWGCLTLGFFFTIFGGCTTFLAYKTYSLVREYTYDEPAKVPTRNASDREAKKLQERIQAFKIAMQEDKLAKLILTADDLNLLIANSDLAGIAYASIKDNIVTLRGSFPLEKVPGFAGRYIHGQYSFKVSLENGQLIYTPTEIKLTDKKMPKEFEEIFRDAAAEANFEKMNQEINRRPETKAITQKLKDVYIENNKIILVR